MKYFLETNAPIILTPFHSLTNWMIYSFWGIVILLFFGTIGFLWYESFHLKTKRYLFQSRLLALGLSFIFWTLFSIILTLKSGYPVFLLFLLYALGYNLLLHVLRYSGRKKAYGVVLILGRFPVLMIFRVGAALPFSLPDEDFGFMRVVAEITPPDSPRLQALLPFIRYDNSLRDLFSNEEIFPRLPTYIESAYLTGIVTEDVQRDLDDLLEYRFDRFLNNYFYYNGPQTLATVGTEFDIRNSVHRQAVNAHVRQLAEDIQVYLLSVGIDAETVALAMSRLEVPFPASLDSAWNIVDLNNPQLAIGLPLNSIVTPNMNPAQALLNSPLNGIRSQTISVYTQYFVNTIFALPSEYFTLPNLEINSQSFDTELRNRVWDLLGLIYQGQIFLAGLSSEETAVFFLRGIRQLLLLSLPIERVDNVMSDIHNDNRLRLRERSSLFTSGVALEGPVSMSSLLGPTSVMERNLLLNAGLRSSLVVVESNGSSSRAPLVNVRPGSMAIENMLNTNLDPPHSTSTDPTIVTDLISVSTRISIGISHTNTVSGDSCSNDVMNEGYSSSNSEVSSSTQVVTTKVEPKGKEKI